MGTGPDDQLFSLVATPGLRSVSSLMQEIVHAIYSDAHCVRDFLAPHAGCREEHGFMLPRRQAQGPERLALMRRALETCGLRIPRNSPTQSTLNSPGRSAGFRPPSEAAPAADAKRQRVPLIITSFSMCSG